MSARSMQVSSACVMYTVCLGDSRYRWLYLFCVLSLCIVIVEVSYVFVFFFKQKTAYEI